MYTWLFILGQLCSGNLPPGLHYVHLGNPCEIAHMGNFYVIVLDVQCCKVKTNKLVKKSMLKVNFKTCPQVVTWTKGNSSLLHIALMIIQEMPSRGHPGLDYNNSKAVLHLCLEMSILFELNCISLHKVFLFKKILFNKLEAATFLFVFFIVKWKMSVATMWQPIWTTK